MLADFITSEMIRLDVNERDWEGAVHAAGGLLVAQGAVEARYVEAMKRAVRQLGPYMVIAPGVALLHASAEAGVKRVGVSLVTLDPPVPFGHEDHDPVDIAIALAVPDDRAHFALLSELAEILSDQTRVERIRRAVVRTEVLDVLSTETRAE